MSRRERKRAYRRLKRLRSDIRVVLKRISRSRGQDIDRLEREVRLLTKRKRKAKKRFALLKASAPKEAEPAKQL